MSDMTVIDVQTGEVSFRNYTQEEIDNIARAESKLDAIFNSTGN